MFTPMFLKVLRATADFYGAPVMDCPIRACQRARACRFPAKSHDPACLARLDTAVIFQLANTACEILEDRHLGVASSNPEKRETEGIAIEIARLTVASDDTLKPLFRNFLRRYRKPPMSGEEFRQFKAEAEAELAAGRRSIESWPKDGN